jgi:hypothetical protein
MASPYFSYVPDFEYVNRLKENKNISSYLVVKNLFKRGKLRDDILQDLVFFTKYKVVGDDRPDSVAFKIYGNQYLDWLVLLSNNVINFEDEWPKEQQSFINYLYRKYRTDAKINAVHHYESSEVKDSKGKILIPKGLKVPSDFSLTYYDSGLGTETTVSGIANAVTNYQYEEKIEDDKRNIYLLKPRYVNLAIEDMEDGLPYRSGSSQYITDDLSIGENIRLYS